MDTGKLIPIFDYIVTVINFIRDIVFVALGAMSFKLGSFGIPGVDSTVDKHMN